MKRSFLALLFATAGVAALSQNAFAQADRTPAPARPQAPIAAPASSASELPTDRLARADGARVVPDRFLRAWDPITVFFDTDAATLPPREVIASPAVSRVKPSKDPVTTIDRPASD